MPDRHPDARPFTITPFMEGFLEKIEAETLYGEGSWISNPYPEGRTVLLREHKEWIRGAAVAEELARLIPVAGKTPA